MVSCVCGVLIKCVCSGLVGGLPFMACAALLACVGGLALIMRLGLVGLILWFRTAHAFLTIASLCKTYSG